MKVKTSELEGPSLDWAVAVCEGYECQFDDEGSGAWLVPQENYLFDEKPLGSYRPSLDWQQGGPIIEREIGNLWKHNKLNSTDPDVWSAAAYHKAPDGTLLYYEDGPTPLIAAMRCFVASRLGDEVEIPEDLLCTL